MVGLFNSIVSVPIRMRCSRMSLSLASGPECDQACSKPEAVVDANPAKAAVPLPAKEGWDGYLVFDNDKVGIWTVKPYQVFPQYGTPEIVGLDDKGRCLVIVSYSGKWTPMVLGHDGKWLGGLTHGDIDPRISGSELYTGGRKGNLYQITSHPQGAADFRLIAYLPGREIHTILSGDLDPRTKGRELLVFTRPGGLFRLTPDGKDGKFITEHLQDLPGRVRDALILPGKGEASPEIVTVSRSGRLELLTIDSDGLKWSTLYQDEMGMGRLTPGPHEAGKPVVFYASHDDGRILRFAKEASGKWRAKTIFQGPQGPRGIAAGRFCNDPEIESIAVFGYSSEVILLTRKGKGPWKDQVIFEDCDKGHWLGTAELDGRNATRELIGSGYGGRIFMLARPPEYGLKTK